MKNEKHVDVLLPYKPNSYNLYPPPPLSPFAAPIPFQLLLSSAFIVGKI